MGAPPDFARDRDVVYAPHLYQGGLDGRTDQRSSSPARAPTRRSTAVRRCSPANGAAIRAGRRIPSDGYFLEHQRLQDESRIGATLWTWRESCGDPHKAGDVRAGNVPYVWGEFEVDCTTGNTVTGVRQDLVDQLTRGYVRAAPGRLETTTWNATAGALTASGVDAPAGAELLVFYPIIGTADVVLSPSGLDDVRLVRSAAGDNYVAARAVGGAWTLTIGRAS